jgi:hypothetical protein
MVSTAEDRQLVFGVFFVFFFFAILGFELGAYTLSHFTSLFFDGVFQGRVSQTICMGWL